MEAKREEHREAVALDTKGASPLTKLAFSRKFALDERCEVLTPKAP
jgi:hypothetical protein